MSAGLPSDEVADDYKNSLEDLVTNDRYQIGNLTVIAKENIEHGEAIARVLENHIQRAPPARKLPAIYVLDSIVKNVGTPYTVYFGRNLYNTFMNAYTLVDGNVRKKLDETLKTWREPVPGSLSTTPVFRLDITQRIVDALSKARLAAQQNRSQQRLPMDPRMVVSQAQPFRNTPTPPHTLSNYRGPAYGTQVQSQSRNGFTATYTNPNISQPPQTPYPSQAQSAPTYQNSQYGATHRSSLDPAPLYRDIDNLILDTKIDCANNPMDQAARTKLSSLQSLRNIVEMGKLSEKDLHDIQISVSEQMAQRAMPSRLTPPPVSTPVPSSSTLPYSVPLALPPPTQAATPSFINSSSLAELIRATANRNQPTPPPPPPLPSLPFQPQLKQTPPTQNITPNPTATENPLIAQLRASGLLPATPTPPVCFPNQPAGPGANAQTPNTNPSNGYMPLNSIGVQFTSASIRIPRPQLITSLFSARPNACNTCGRRFASDEVGREQKAKHLDWHFKTKSRMADAEKKGQSRSWYVDEREWISSKEYVDGTGPDETSGDGSGFLSPSAGKTKLLDFVRAPNNPHLKSLPCPIDLEPFVSFWSDELQEFIWTDAMQVGDRIYHASCYRQAMADRAKAATPVGAGSSGGVSTPDSVLGKRKAEEAANGIAAKIKVESEA